MEMIQQMQSINQIKLTSLIIAKDEEQNITRCIESQLACVDEIIVLIDDTTADRTEEIVRTFPQVRYEKVTWEGFSKTKQQGLSLASNNWIFWIDADEAVTKPLNDELLHFKKSIPKFIAYSFPRRAFFLGKWIKHSGWYPGRVTRLFRKDKIQFSGNDVHEYLLVNEEVGMFINDIDHFTDPSIEHYFTKFNSYTSLAAKELFKREKSFKKTDVLLRPLFIFLKMYIFRLGFLDGFHGFLLAVFSSHYVFTKYAKLWELYQQKEK
ncbi:MAG: glycosyltransferase family 2 protein [Ignavibacteriaceae bacterium]|nr:glycosyltransferase family 2 protein [Ignavibacteriaceae bacterium]